MECRAEKGKRFAETEHEEGIRRQSEDSRPGRVIFDDTGDNISRENPYYGELTGLYWLWKNLDMPDSEMIGFCHYNKMLDISGRRVERLLSTRVGWIAADRTAITGHTFPEDIRVLLNVLAELPDRKYLQACTSLYDEKGASAGHRRNCSAGQMFYTTMPEFRRYCAFLFDVLDKVRAYIGEVDRPPYHRRYCAFLGERLLSVYLEAEDLPVSYAGIRKKENRLITLMRRAARTAGLGAYLRPAEMIRRIKGTDRPSSWSREES